MQEHIVIIKNLPIKLGQFLKLAEIVADGVEAKARIAGQEISVNGAVETRRGRQLHHGDRIVVRGVVYFCSRGEVF